MSKAYRNPPTDALIAAFAPYVVGAVALYFVFKKSKSELPVQIERVTVAAGQIKRGLPGFMSEWWNKSDDRTYVSQAQAKLDDAAALAVANARRARGLQ